jgi:drug/metabolite transporter (DMT)-like permease
VTTSAAAAPSASSAPSLRVGVLAAVAAALIGAGWQVASRLGATTTLAPVDLALLRYVVPAIALAPVWLRHGLVPKGVPRTTVALMVLGAGFPFGLLGMTGAAYAPAAHMGALLPGSMPLFVALLSALVLGERFARARLAGFALLVAGIACVAGPVALAAGGGGGLAWVGHILFLSAAALWAVYTVAARGSGLGAWTATATVSAWSAPMAVVAWLASNGSRLMDAPAADVAVQVVWQGLLAGVGGVAAYTLAVRHLGPSRASVSGAAVPVMSALGGAAVLGEAVDAWTAAGVAAAAAGVALASGAVRLGRRAPADRPDS